MTADLSWDALRLFIAVFRTGSFSAAADELAVAQSSVSEHIARLERRLGYQLFDRGPSGVDATARGRELAARISPAVDALAAATGAADAQQRAPRTLFLGGPTEFLSDVVLPGLASQLPDGVQVTAQFGLSDALLEDLRAGAIDLLISTVPARGPDVSVEPIYDEEFVLVAHPQWERRAAQDLESIPLLAYGPELPIIRRYWRSVFGQRPTLTPTIVAPDLRTLRDLAVSGAGMSVLPTYLISGYVTEGKLTILHSPDIPPLNTLYIVTRATRLPADPVVTTIRDAIIALTRRLP